MKFTSRSTAEQVTDGLDLTGKTAVITGINSGLGFETMRVLSMRGAKVIGLARTLEKAQQACDRVSGETIPVACDLSDWASVREAAIAIREIDCPVSMLICNAGVISTKKLTLAHGLELQFATNHMGHFILAYHLVDQLKSAQQGRAVLLSSAAHRVFTVKGGIDFDNLDAHKSYSPLKFYGQSKMANLLHAKALAKRLVATRPELTEVSGMYFSDCKQAKHRSLADNEALIERLWQYSEDVAAPYLE